MLKYVIFLLCSNLRYAFMQKYSHKSVSPMKYVCMLVYFTTLMKFCFDSSVIIACICYL